MRRRTQHSYGSLCLVIGILSDFFFFFFMFEHISLLSSEILLQPDSGNMFGSLLPTHVLFSCHLLGISDLFHVFEITPAHGLYYWYSLHLNTPHLCLCFPVFSAFITRLHFRFFLCMSSLTFHSLTKPYLCCLTVGDNTNSSMGAFEGKQLLCEPAKIKRNLIMPYLSFLVSFFCFNTS